MFDLHNLTPFKAEASALRDRDGAETLVVAVKATYRIAPDGDCTLADEQVDVCAAPEFTGPPGTSSMRYDSDFVLTKVTTDVLLHGHAYAPDGKATTCVEVGMGVGTLRKALRVNGDRVWEGRLWGERAGKPAPFEKMPLTYERAFGGPADAAQTGKADWDRRNPVGVGFARSASELVGHALPNLEYADEPVVHWQRRPRPAGFGPIAVHWLPRAPFGGTYDHKWEQERFPLLPLDFQDRFYQCAPQDQQSPQFLHGGENVTLLNLTPDGQLRFELPRVRLGFITSIGQQVHKHRGVLHTVILEPDVPRLILVWHTSLRCHGKLLKIDHINIYEKTPLHPATPGSAHGLPVTVD